MQRAAAPLLVLLALVACDRAPSLGGSVEGVDSVDDPGLPPEQVDDDGDGFTEEEGDCDDANADANPDGDEGDVANGDDEDCNGVADDRSVCADGLADYDGIQDAIDDSPDGFTLLVCAGTYYENLAIAKDITVLAVEGAELTTLDGGAQGSVVRVTGNSTDAAVVGFTVQNGVATMGGGVFCDSADFTLSDSIVRGNSAEQAGGGLAAQGCDLVVSGSSFRDNGTAGIGGGIYTTQTGGQILSNTVENNEAMEGGGIAVNAGGLSIEANVVSGNSSTTIDEEYRGAGSGGGGVFMAGDVDLVGNEISDNHSAYNGGGIIVFQGTGDILDNTIVGNLADEDGGGMYTNRSRNRIEGNYMAQNEAADDAGGIRVYIGQLQVIDNEFIENSAGDDGGGLKLSHSTNTIRSNYFEGNSAGDAGGGLELDNETADVSDCVFVGNSARRGGGLHTWENEGTHTLHDLHFEGNVASDCGGGIGMDNDRYRVTFERISLVGNQANDGAAFCNDLVLIYPDDETQDPYNFHSVATLRNVWMWDNQASDDGGVAYVKAGTIEFVNVTAHDNAGPGASGIAVKEDGLVQVRNGLFSDHGGGTFMLSESEGAASFAYTGFDGNGGAWLDLANPVGSNGNADLDAGYVDANGGDFHLSNGSSAANAGDPSIKDADNSRSDMGAFGGPGGNW